jgi:magnesium-protoporphyrin O-methyltransferase
MSVGRRVPDVSCCCSPSGYDDLFGEKQGRRDARRYRRRGLDTAAQWIVDTARNRGVRGATVLEPGGGVGAIQIELLKAGAARSTIVELSTGYDEAAGELAREAGVEARIERRIGDFAENGVGEADMVVLHRVVCCYPDYERLLGAAAAKARKTVIFTHPPRNAVWRACFAGMNLWMRLRGSDFRVFAHPPEAMNAAVRRHGFESVAFRHGLWHGAAFERRSAYERR